MPPRVRQSRACQVVGMWRSGVKQSTIAARLRLAQGTVFKIISRYRRHQHVRPGVSSGQPRKTSVREDRILYRLCRQNRTKSASYLRDRWQQVINTRVSSRLLSQGLRARRLTKKPLLNMVRKTRRLEWAWSHQNWQHRHWRHVLFSDESRFLLRVGERFQEDCVVRTVAHGGGSVYVWGAIHYGPQRRLLPEGFGDRNGTIC